MFNYHDFVLEAIKGMVSNEPDYKIRLRAVAQQEINVLSLEDLAEIDALIVAQYPPVESEVIE